MGIPTLKQASNRCTTHTLVSIGRVSASQRSYLNNGLPKSMVVQQRLSTPKSLLDSLLFCGTHLQEKTAESDCCGSFLLFSCFCSSLRFDTAFNLPLSTRSTESSFVSKLLWRGSQYSSDFNVNF